MTLVRSGFVALLALALVIAAPTVASAKFTNSSTAALSASTDTLSPPSGVSITCNRSVGFVIKWKATTDTYATGYTLSGAFLGATGSASVSGRTTTSYSYASDVASGTTVQLVSVYKSWTSAKTAAVPIYC